MRNFTWCLNLTDKALEHLKGMPLTSVNFGCCHITPKALAELKAQENCLGLSKNGVKMR